MIGPVKQAAQVIQIAAGQRLRAKDERIYVVDRISTFSMTLRREVPKVRGKAAVKAAKRARQRARGAIAA